MIIMIKKPKEKIRVLSFIVSLAVSARADSLRAVPHLPAHEFVPPLLALLPPPWGMAEVAWLADHFDCECTSERRGGAKLLGGDLVGGHRHHALLGPGAEIAGIAIGGDDHGAGPQGMMACFDLKPGCDLPYGTGADAAE